MNQCQPERKPPRRRFSVLRFVKRLFLLVCCLALAFVAVRYGPTAYRLLFGKANTQWISERFGEELKAKNELVVYETTITGQETVSTDAWLIGTVQKVVVPYSYAIRFVVDLSNAQVSVNNLGNIEVRLPSPSAAYDQLTVNEEDVQKDDLFYPLTAKRYAEIKEQITQKLYDECAQKPEYLNAAWDSAVTSLKGLFDNVAKQSEQGATCEVIVIRDSALNAATEAPTETPAA